MTRDEIKNLAALVVLRAQIKKEQAEVSMLVGSQWVIVEIIVIPAYDDVPERAVAKIFGCDSETGRTVSAPIDYWRTHQFCGISYYTGNSVMTKEMHKGVREIQRKTGFQYAFYNPYQDKVLTVAPIDGKEIK